MWIINDWFTGGAWSSRPGVNVNTVHWQATTEANFITKPRPVSWEKPSTGRPKPTKKFTTTTQKPPTTKTSPHPKPYTASHKPPKASTASPPTTHSTQDGHSSSAGYQSTYGSTVAPANNNGILSPSSSPVVGSTVTTAATKDVGQYTFGIVTIQFFFNLNLDFGTYIDGLNY